MILFAAGETGRGGRITYQGRELDMGRPWERMTVQEAFGRFATMTADEALDRGLFDQLLVEEVEPGLNRDRPVFLYDYPVSLAALARLKKGATGLAERFELYMSGLEIANAFSELTDPQEQRKRFEEEMAQRRRMGKEAYPMPERFLESLGAMPQAAGIALGIDRLVMLFTDSADIDDVVSFTPEEL